MKIVELFLRIVVLAFNYFTSKQDRSFYDLRIEAANEIIKQRKIQFQRHLDAKDLDKLSGYLSSLVDDIDRLNKLRESTKHTIRQGD